MGARSESLYRGGVVGDRVEAKRLREISTISGRYWVNYLTDQSVHSKARIWSATHQV